jgi:hypothetical protein
MMGGQFDRVFSWPLLLHETFHYLYFKEGFDKVEKACKNFSWLEEALVEIFVINFFGPAYALSLANYLQKYPHDKTVSHPSFVSRIFIALKYLEHEQDEEKLPLPTFNHVDDVFDYLKRVWDEHKETDPEEVREEVSDVYDTAERSIKKLIAERDKPFSEFLTANEKERLKVFEKKSNLKFSENQFLSVSDVMKYFEYGIPAAADPRVVFNSFISTGRQEILNERKTNIFIKESLKKWHLKKEWMQAKERFSKP